jgi:hypothetical protein
VPALARARGERVCLTEFPVLKQSLDRRRTRQNAMKDLYAFRTVSPSAQMFLVFGVSFRPLAFAYRFLAVLTPSCFWPLVPSVTSLWFFDLCFSFPTIRFRLPTVPFSGFPFWCLVLSIPLLSLLWPPFPRTDKGLNRQSGASSPLASCDFKLLTVLLWCRCRSPCP